jgi:hypothetical protein
MIEMLVGGPSASAAVMTAPASVECSPILPKASNLGKHDISG